ncbi:protein mono-ADP-ribosyltransferase PARP14-like isoform X1 [Mobula birostris]|uniref:protein mono-ADP-ribosyltransferase PARP14-like isoform X1 n=1 Tax=Mobula birostris TaxID=1983395 RepID=UPI003B28B84A
MPGFPLLVEGLPVSFDSVKNKLAIYFQSKKKSGGDECEIKAHADPTKFLVYFESEKVQKHVARREFHMVQLLAPEPVRLRVTIYEGDNGSESSVNPIGATPDTNRGPAVEQSLLLTTSSKQNEREQSQPKEVQIPETLPQHQESEFSSNQLLVSSNCPVDTELVTMLFEKISPDVEVSANNECSWILTCLSQHDLEKIISRRPYTITGTTLEVQLYDKRKEDEKYESRKFVLKGFDGSFKLSYISLYIDSLSSNIKHDIEPLQDGTTVAVTFKTDIDGNAFVRNCHQKPLKNCSITASRLEKTDSVLIEKLHPKITEELLDLYFSNASRSGGGEIADIQMNDRERRAIIRFCDPEVVRKVTEKEHYLKDSRLTVSCYYHDLQLSLYGANSSKDNLPEPFSIDFNPSLLNYIRTNKQHYTHELEQITKDFHCNIIFEDTPNSKEINLKPSLDAEVLLWYKVAKNWKKLATEAVEKFKKRFDFKDFPIDQDLWKKVECDVKQLKLPCLDILHLPVENKIVVVGEERNVSDISRKLQAILENERNTIEEEIAFESFEELEFLQAILKDSVSFVKISINSVSPALTLKGLKQKVRQAQNLISVFQSQLEKKPLNQSSHMKDFVKSLDLKNIVQTHFVPNKVQATLMIRESVELLAFKTDVKKAEDKIKELFQEEVVTIIPEQIQVTQDVKWTRFLDDLKAQHKHSCRIVEKKNPASIIIVGFSSHVPDVAKVLKSYLNKNQMTMKFISAAVVHVDYMEKFSILKEFQSNGVDISFIRAPSPGVQVTDRAEQIDETVSAIKDKLGLVRKQTFTYSKAGESTALNRHNDTLQAKAVNHECMLFISVKEEFQSGVDLTKHVRGQGGKDVKLGVTGDFCFPVQAKSLRPEILFSSYPIWASFLNYVQQFLKSLSKLLSGPTVKMCGITVQLKKGDITQERTDIIVNSTNTNLNLASGVSGAILKAAGSSVQAECAAQGSQPDGSIVVTSSGQLRCQYIVHVIRAVKPAIITASVSKVLQECEKLNVTTVAFPAMGTGKGGVTAEDAINATFRGLEDYFLNVTSSNMKTISIVAFEPHIYDYFADFFNKKATAPVTVNSSVQQKNLLPTQLKIQNTIVEVKAGDITQENVDAIVNSTNTTLNLNSGVSKAILAKGGQTVTDECKNLVPQPNNGVVVTGSGQLPCKHIIHMVGQTDPALITASVEKVLEECEKNNITTVTFPALGTGVGNVRSEVSAESMLVGFENHLVRNQSSVIQFIYMIALEPNVHKVFSDVLQENSQQKLQTFGMDIGNVKVVVVQGDIVKEITDAIVNSTNVHLSLKTGVSQAILRAGGQQLEDECKALGVQNENSVVTTGAGNLHVKYVIHMVEWTKANDIKGSIGKVLAECEKVQINSVSFPTIGTGAGKLHPSVVANALLDAIHKYVTDYVPSALSEIRIILFTPITSNLFHKCMKKRFTTWQYDEQTTSPLDLGHQIEQVKPVEYVYPIIINTKRQLTSTIEIYGMSDKSIDEVRKNVENLIKQTCKSKTIENEGTSYCSLDQMQKLVDLCENLQLRVEIQPNNIIINGYVEEHVEFIMKFNSMVHSAKDQMSRKQEEAQTKAFVQWEFEHQGKFQPYDQSLNYDLEKASRQKTKILTVKKNGETHTINFKKMQVTDSKGNTSQIRRHFEGGTFELPGSWSNMTSLELLQVDLPNGTEEYNEVADKFKKSCQNHLVKIIEIKRIQNRKLWQSYSVRKQTVERKLPGTNVERILYHGTTKEITNKVNSTGFNRSFCGRNATAYGKGTYFALKAAYSCDNKYSSPDNDGTKFIYQARVITGNMCIGNNQLLEPTPVNAQLDPNDLCDCAVDNLTKPTIFVVFCDDGAYPEYLITFKTEA